jgi:hypothetical protein
LYGEWARGGGVNRIEEEVSGWKVPGGGGGGDV